MRLNPYGALAIVAGAGILLVEYSDWIVDTAFLLQFRMFVGIGAVYLAVALLGGGLLALDDSRLTL